MPILQSLFEYKAWANRELLDAIGKLDAVVYPMESRLSIRLLNHTYVIDQIFTAHLLGKPHTYAGANTPETPTLNALRAAITSSDGWLLSYARSLTEAQLREQVKFTFTDAAKGTMTREEILMHLITHGGYHRGAIGNILSQAGIAPPRDILTVYLHQAESRRREH
jgi:uncharacterized damage-inducible protein DinB